MLPPLRLNLFLSLTNLRGVPYSLDGEAAIPGEAGSLTLLQQAAKTTGAFPVFLAPRSRAERVIAP